MPFEPSDFEDLVRFLGAHPDMRDQLRLRFLNDDSMRRPLGDLTARVVRLSEASTHLAARVDDLAGRPSHGANN